MNRNVYQQEKNDWNQNYEYYLTYDNSIFRKYLYEKIISFYNIKKGRVIEIGSATGKFLSLLSPKCEKYGLDFSKKFIKKAKKSYPRINFFLSSAQKIPFPANYFDAIVSNRTLHHLKAEGVLDDFIKEADRILKDGGMIYIHERNDNVIGDFVLNFFYFFRWYAKKLKIIKSSISSDNEMQFGIKDLYPLMKIKNYTLTKQKFIFSLPFLVIVTFTNTIQYIFGFRISEIFRYVCFPMIIFLENTLSSKYLFTEELYILKKEKR